MMNNNYNNIYISYLSSLLNNVVEIIWKLDNEIFLYVSEKNGTIWHKYVIFITLLIQYITIRNDTIVQFFLSEVIIPNSLNLNLLLLTELTLCGFQISVTSTEASISFFITNEFCFILRMECSNICSILKFWLASKVVVFG